MNEIYAGSMNEVYYILVPDPSPPTWGLPSRSSLSGYYAKTTHGDDVYEVSVAHLGVA